MKKAALIIVFVLGLTLPVGVFAQTCNTGDGDGNGKVDGFDYVIWWQNFNQNVSGPQNGDFDCSGYADGFDYVIWWQNFGLSSITPTPPLGSGFTGISSGQTVSGGIAVTYEADTATTASVDFYIDNNLVRTEVSYPYALGGDSGVGNVHPYDTTQLTNGTHVLKVIVTQTNSQTYTDQLTFYVNNGSGSPTNTPTPTLPPQPTPTSGHGNVYWRGDAETGNLSQWCNVHEAAPGRITVVTDPVKQGKYAYRFELRDGDSVFSTERVVLNQGLPELTSCIYERDGEDKYYGWSVYLPTNFPKYPSWSLVAQWKGIHTGSPPIQLGLNNDEWRLYYRPNTSSGNILKWAVPVVKGRWESFVMHVKWSTDPSVGFIELWYNGNKVVPLFHTSNVHLSSGQPVPNFVEIGNYRDASISSDVILYHDGFTVGSTYASVAQ